MTITDTVEIKTTPERIENWMMNIEKSYKDWHPNHVKWVNLKGNLNEGGIVYFEEYLNGKLYKAKWKFSKIERNGKTSIKYKGLGFLERIFGVKGSFIIEPKGNDCLLTAALSLGGDWLISKFYKGMIEAVKKHMKEEGENLKRILEKT